MLEMIDCVSIATSHHFTGDPLREQHRLRYAEVVVKEGWRDVDVIDDMEFDRFDTHATEYFVSRDQTEKVLGVIRSNPTILPYMLEERFRYLVRGSLPKDPHIFEASRIVVDRTTLETPEQRKPVVNELLVALMERGLQRKLTAYIGFMIPGIWDSTFRRIGWEPEWLGPETPLPDTDYIVRAGRLDVDVSIYEQLKKSTGLSSRTILNFGRGEHGGINEEPLRIPDDKDQENKERA